MKYNTYKTALLFMMGVAFTNNALAQQALSLPECKEKALNHNQTVKAAIFDLKSNQAALKLSKRASLPTVDFSSNYLYLNDPNQMVVPGYELPTITGNPSGVYSPGNVTNLTYKNTYSANIGLNLPIYMGGKIQQYKKISTYALEAADNNVQLKKSDVLLNVESLYWNLVALQEQKTVLEKSIVFLNDVVKEVNNWHQTGILTKNEVLKTQVELNNANLALMELTNNIELVKMSLNQSIGNGILSAIQIQDSIIIIPATLSSVAFSDEQLASRPEIKMLNSQLDISKSQKKIINADYMPQLVSYANYVAQNPNHFAEQKNEFTFNAGVSLNIPVFHWGEKRLKKYQQQMTIEKAENQLDQSTEMLTLEIRQAIFRLKESLVKLDFTKTSLTQAQENLKLENNRLLEGITTTRELLNAQLQWQQSHADFIHAKTEVKINEATYYKSIGQLPL